MNLTCIWSDTLYAVYATLPELPWCLDVAPLSSWCLFSRLYRLIPMSCASQVSCPTHVSAKQNKGHWRVFSVNNLCVCACVRVCENFQDGVDLLALDFEIQAFFWNFHHVQGVYYQLVVVNVSTAWTPWSKVHGEIQFPVLNTHVQPKNNTTYY